MHKRLNELGQEIPDPKPVVLDGGLRRPLPLQERITKLVSAELSRRAAEAGRETFDESEDFDVDDDFEAPEKESRYQVAIEEEPVKPKQVRRIKKNADDLSKAVSKPDKSGNDNNGGQDVARGDTAGSDEQ